jgi:hypothetical protein
MSCRSSFAACSSERKISALAGAIGSAPRPTALSSISFQSVPFSPTAPPMPAMGFTMNPNFFNCLPFGACDEGAFMFFSAVTIFSRPPQPFFIFLEMFLYGVCEGVFSHCANYFLGNVTVFKDQEVGDTHDAVAAGNIRIIVNIEFSEHNFSSEFLS